MPFHGSCFPTIDFLWNISATTQENLIEKGGVKVIAKTFQSLSSTITTESAEFRAIGNSLHTLGNLSDHSDFPFPPFFAAKCLIFKYIFFLYYFSSPFL